MRRKRFDHRGLRRNPRPRAALPPPDPMETDSWRPSRRPQSAALLQEFAAAFGEPALQSRIAPRERRPISRSANAIPLTIDEFVAAQRFFPIVFSGGDNAGAAGAAGPERGRQRLRRRRGRAAQPILCPGLCPPLSLSARQARREGRGAVALLRSRQRAGRRVRRRQAAVRRRQAERGAQRDPQILRGFRDRRPAHQRLRQGAGRRWTC